MNDSNRTLKFSRTYREATGTDFYNVDDDRDWLDKLGAWLICMGIVFFIGFALGARFGGAA